MGDVVDGKDWAVRDGAAPSLRMIRVAFFRNLNLGQARSHSPTSQQLLDALVAAGARSPSHVGANGTVVYYWTGGPVMARQAVRLLTPVCGYDDLVVVRSGSWLARFGRRLEGLDEGEVVQYDAAPGLDYPTPIECDDGLVVTHLDHRAAITTHRPGSRPVSAGPFVASLVGVPTTVRGIGTIRRVLDRVRDYA